jgi:hypothetical protein
MPKAPILARRGYFDTISRSNPIIRFLDWNVVDTELGSMVEPRQDIRGIPTAVAGANGLVQVDLIDSGFTAISQMNSDTFYSQFGTDGQQVAVDVSA